jgi:hypothetical protein
MVRNTTIEIGLDTVMENTFSGSSSVKLLVAAFRAS